MKLSSRYAVVGIGGLALLSGVHWMRGLHSDWPPIVSYLLGVMPNVAAAIAVPFVFMGIWADQHQDAAPATVRRRFYVSAFVALGGLIAWELLQIRSTNLIFDVNDIAATVVGIAIAAGFFTVLTPRAVG